MSRANKRMLIDATHPEEVRVAIVNGQKLDDLDVEYTSKEQKKSNVYLATISRIEPSLEAVFVNYGANRHGFLPLKEIEHSYFLSHTNDPKSDIKKILSEGQELLIQVDKEERGNKGAALTTYISLAGCYLVLMPNNPKAGGISRRIEGEDRDEMKETLNALTIPDSMGVIIRTAGLGKKQSDLQWDLDVLLHHWNAIKTAASSMQAPCLLHQESNIIIRTIRDNLKPDIKEILIDDEKVYNQAKQYMELLRSDSKNIVQHYTDSVPLFTKFQIESQIEEAYHHEIRLPSGGSIVLDRTEALTAIDINSAQSTKGQDIENTALNTNLEAATEIARQLRLRDVGGLIVIDFIDMTHVKNQREVENKLREELQNDRAKTQINRLSKFGLLEMSRQRLKASLGENTQVICNKCSGKGSLRTVESLALSLLRLIEEEALKPNTSEVQTQLPIELCTFLANEKRQNVLEIEQRCNVRIILIPNPHYMFPNYHITRIKTNENKPVEVCKSYTIIEKPRDEQYIASNKTQSNEAEAAVLQQFNTISKKHAQRTKPNLLQRLWSSLFDSNQESDNLRQKQHKHNHNFKDRNKEREHIDSKDRDHRANRDNQKSHPNRKMADRNTADRNKPAYNNSRVSTKNRNKNRNLNPSDPNRKVKKPYSANEQGNTPSHPFKERTEQSTHRTRDENSTTTNIQHQGSEVTFTVQDVVTHKDNKIKKEPNLAANKNTDRKRQKPVNSNVNLSTITPTVVEEIPVFKKRNSLTKISISDNLSKRSFYPKKKLVFETDKNNNNPEPNLINENNN